MYSIILFAEYILVNKLQDNVQHCSQCQDTCAAAARVARKKRQLDAKNDNSPEKKRKNQTRKKEDLYTKSFRELKLV